MQRLSTLCAACLLALVACDDAATTASSTDTFATDATVANDTTVAPTDTTVASDTTVVANDTTVAPDTTVAHDTTPADVADVAAQPALVVTVTVPDDTPAGSTVYMSGNQPELGDWDGQGAALTRGADGRWTTTLSFALGTTLEFKLTRGSWDTVEKDDSGAEIPNRTHVVGAAHDALDVAVASWRDLAPAPPSASRIDFIRGVGSQFLGPDRDVIVYLPPGYDSAGSARFPVLYMHDGQNLMDPDTSAFGVAWEIDDTATALIDQHQIEPVIIVGIYNTGDRMSEYTEAVDQDYGGGNADNYGRFIVEELKPDIDDTYRTEPEQAVTGMCGSSLGGLVSMYFGLTLSDTFGRIGAVSPSVWWANGDIVDRVNALDHKTPIRIWLDIGTAEGSGQSALNDARTLRDALVGKGWVLGQDLLYGEYPGAAHNETAWAARADDILRALYPR